MEDTESEQSVACVDGENNLCTVKEAQVKSESTSIKRTEVKNKSCEENERTKQVNDSGISENDNITLESLEWITGEQESDGMNFKNEEKENLLHNINSSFVDALCEAEVEKNLTELEDKVKNMLEELEQTETDDSTEKLVVEMDINDIQNLREELNDLVSTNRTTTSESNEPEIDTRNESESKTATNQFEEDVDNNAENPSQYSNYFSSPEEKDTESVLDDTPVVDCNSVLEVVVSDRNEGQVTENAGVVHEPVISSASLEHENVDSQSTQEQDKSDSQKTEEQINIDLHPIEEKNDVDSQATEEQNNVDSQPTEEQNNVDPQQTEEQNNVDSQPTEEQNSDASQPSKEQNEIDSQAIEEQNDVDSQPTEEQNDVDSQQAEEQNNVDSEPIQEVTPNISILENTLINGKESTISQTQPDKSDSITENVPVIKSEKSDTIDNCDNNSPNHMSNEIAPDINTSVTVQNKRWVIFFSFSIYSNQTSRSNTAAATKTNQIQPAAPDLIVREFCLQQDSLCNLVSASIESSLSVNDAQKAEQEASLVQHLLLSEPGITSFKAIEEIFRLVNNLSSTEYFLLYTKLTAKCVEVSKGSLTTAFDLKRRSKITDNPVLNKEMQDMASRILNKASLDEVDKILSIMDGINPNELLFLHMGLPKGYKSIKDALRITTICCRPIVSQTIMWLRTHYEEALGVLICKPEVFKNYQYFCEKNQIKPCGIPDFGKIIKRIFPKIFHRRQVVRGKTQYFYCGLKRRYQLSSPKLPSLSAKTEDLFGSTSSESVKKPRPPKDPDFYKKGDFVNGKSILVHDPLELLSLSMNDSTQTNTNAQTHSSRKDQLNVAGTQKDLPTLKEYKNKKPKSRSRGRILKTKFKQYRHPSVKNIMDKFKNVIVPYDLYNTNVNPVVALNNKELHNWCAANIEKFIDQISNINIIKNNDSSKLKVKYECCGKTLKVNQYYGEQLRDLKRELENLEIIQYSGSNDYGVTYVYPTEQLPDLLQVSDRYTKKSFKKNVSTHSKKTVSKSKSSSKTNRSKIASILAAVKNKHNTIEMLLERIDNITLPEQILTRNIDPRVSLDSREVTDWYQERLDVLKCRIENPNAFEDDEVDENEEENFLTDGVENVEINLDNRKRPASNVEIEEPPPPKKAFHLSDIINGSEKEKTVIENTECKMTELTCYFCLKDFQNEKELQNHCDIHLRCRTCKRRMSSQTGMIDHLIKHCFMNNAKCAPNLILPRIDQVQIIVKKYPGAFDPSYTPPINVNEVNRSAGVKRKVTCITMYPPSILNFNNVNHNANQILPAASTTNTVMNNNYNNSRKGKPVHTYSKSQKSTNVARLSKTNSGDVSHYQITTNPFKNMNEVQNLQQSTSHLKSTISNNFNRIFLLSNNSSPPQSDSSDVVYGLYLNNRTDRSSPICLNNFNRLGSDCALNTNPSCSLSESTNFMQIVETPNTSSVSQPTYEPTIMPETTIPPYSQHQDHSYFQQPVYHQINNDVPTIPNGIVNGVHQQNIHPNSMYDMPFLNNLSSETQSCGNSLVNTVNKVESTNPPPSTMPGPFRIRVKDIRELS
ncbi:hypothetical protein FQR65_LT10310 [Abscondita terminalis]|nr:hypothetical protein FQR65_LT10310 [Abscondita terminalis]